MDKLLRLQVVYGSVSVPRPESIFTFTIELPKGSLTVATGGATPEIYQAIYERYDQMPIAATFTAHELAMFVYHEQLSGIRDYMTHMVLPLTGA